MGHKIHPDIFRLGISKDWQYQLRDPLLANVFIYKTVKKMFLKYSAPYVSYTIRRNINPRKLELEKHKIKPIRNPFMRDSLVFSHLNISYGPSLLLAIFVLDVGAEALRAKKNLREKPFYYLSGALSYEIRRSYYYFRKYMYLPNPAKYSRKAYIWKRYKWFYYLGLDRNGIKVNQFIKDLIIKIKESCPKLFVENRLNIKTYQIGKYLSCRSLYKYHPAWIINNLAFFPKARNGYRFFKHLKILKFLLRFFKYCRYTNLKKRLLFINLLFVCVTSYLFLSYFNSGSIKRKDKLQTVLNKIIYLQSLLFLYLTRFKSIYLRYNKKLLQTRLILYNLYAKILIFTMAKTTFIPNDRQLIVRFLGLNNRNYSAQFLVNYISIKLGQYFNFNSIIKPIIRYYKRRSAIDGFRFIISGRLTRKERAAYIVKAYKAMPLATAKIRVDYASDFKIMRFGVVGIKIYLLTSEDVPYYYFFEFKTKI
uniref:Ribosomal protein S3 n=1 Tax=Physarum polycephalum TaxID=5791 RepID=F2Y9V2_PHYPO|nr:ribosomal protein S3 [Physarum polycephalum]|eukprot:Phypoly_transcript_03963.p1 GENE.Phypoly_transcript_03963~~Phypoly_transcript_03963.p1  ORF type:complete len:479 (+),score=-58.71 Phypoly_transcript_03963:39-1475(+)